MSATHIGGVIRDTDDAAIAVIEAMHAQGRTPEAEDGYADIVRRHHRRATRIALRYLRDTGDVDEVVQDAFLKAYVSLSSFRREQNFQSWLTRILTNSCLDRLKTRRRRRRWVGTVPQPLPGHRDFWEGVAGSTPTPEDRILARERRDRVVQAVTRLPERQRMVVMWCDWKGLTSLEVSALTGWNPNTVRVHLFRGLRALRSVAADAGLALGQDL